jgi:hypothetical protein
MKKTLKMGSARIGLALMCAAVMTFGQAMAAAPPPAPPTYSPAPSKITEAAQIKSLVESDKRPAVREREAALIAASSGRATRTGDNLKLLLKNGQSVTLYTQRLCFGVSASDSNCVEYLLVSDLPERGVYVLQKAMYTRTDYVLIDAETGKQTPLSVFPVFSPDGQRFLVAGFDRADDGDLDAIQIWRRDKDGAVVEWRMPYGNPQLGYVAAAQVVKWDAAGITMEFDPGSSGGKTKWRGLIRKVGNAWELVKG